MRRPRDRWKLPNANCKYEGSLREVWKGGHYEAVGHLYSEEYRIPFGTGPEARIEPIRRYREAFPDLGLDIEELIVAGDSVVLRVASAVPTSVDTRGGSRRGEQWRSGRSPSCTSRMAR
jgi:hypothetical protein